MSYRDIRVEPGGNLDAELVLLPPNSTPGSEPAPPSPADTDHTISLTNPSWSESEEGEEEEQEREEEEEKDKEEMKKQTPGVELAAILEHDKDVAPPTAKPSAVVRFEEESTAVEAVDVPTTPTDDSGNTPSTALITPTTVVTVNTTADRAYSSGASSELEAAQAEAAFEARSSFGRKGSSDAFHVAVGTAVGAPTPTGALYLEKLQPAPASPATHSSPVRARRQWSQRAAAMSAPEAPFSPTPTGLLRKHRVMCHEGEAALTNSRPPLDGGDEDGHLLLRLQSPTGLSAAVAAMEAKQRKVEAERKQAEAEEAAMSASAELEGLALAEAGNEEWTIRTKEILGSPTGAWPAGACACPSPTSASRGTNGLFISSSTNTTSNSAATPTPTLSLPLPSPSSPTVSKRFSRRALPPAVTITTATSPSLRAGSKKPAVTTSPSTSRRFTVTESAAMVDEGKKALLAARQEKRERSEQAKTAATPWQPAPAGGKGFAPSSPVGGVGKTGGTASPTRSFRSGDAVTSAAVSPVSRLPDEKMIMELGALPRSPAGLAPKHVSPLPVNRASRGGVGGTESGGHKNPGRLGRGRERNVAGTRVGGHEEPCGRKQVSFLVFLSFFPPPFDTAARSEYLSWSDGTRL